MRDPKTNSVDPEIKAEEQDYERKLAGSIRFTGQLPLNRKTKKASPANQDETSTLDTLQKQICQSEQPVQPNLAVLFT
jgi:hypothetical protein